MSDPKKDEGKKSFPAKLVAISLSILAVLVFLAVSNVTIPETVNQAAQVTTNTGAALHNLARGTDRFASGGSDWMGSLIKIAIALVVVFLIGRTVITAIKPGGGGGHDDHAHPAKPAEKKADPAHH